MTKTRYIYSIYIKATPEKVWRGLTDPAMTRLYWLHENVSDWKPGSPWEHRRLDSGEPDVVGAVVESDPPRRLVTTWAFPSQRNDPASYSKVTTEIVDVPGAAGVVRLIVTHDDLPADLLGDVSEGWAGVLSGLKTLLETGRPLPNLWAERFGNGETK